MICSSENKINLEICKPDLEKDRIVELIKRLSDESDNLPFTSEDFAIGEENFNSYIKMLNESDNSIFFVAKVSGELVGFGYLEGGRRARTFHCTNLGMGVLKEYNNLGIGTKILTSLVEYASGTECIAKIDLQVKKENKSAINIYKKSGFEVEGVSRRALFIDGEFYDYLNMGKLID